MLYYKSRSRSVYNTASENIDFKLSMTFNLFYQNRGLYENKKEDRGQTFEKWKKMWQ